MTSKEKPVTVKSETGKSSLIAGKGAAKMRLRRKKEKNERRQPIRSDGTSLARFLEVVALIAAIGLLMAPTAVMALYGGGFPEGWQAARMP